MLYMSPPSNIAARAMVTGELGCMTTPKQGNPVPAGAWYGADNGKFGKGWPGPDAWWAWLQKAVAADPHRCLWATAPDVVCDPVGTLTESLPWLPRIRSLGVPAAFVGQDGCEQGLVPWQHFDVLFLGGSTEWKLGPAAEALSREAVARGKRVHMGRVIRFAVCGSRSGSAAARRTART